MALQYKTDGDSNGPILVPISRRHYLPDLETRGTTLFTQLVCYAASSAGSPLDAPPLSPLTCPQPCSDGEHVRRRLASAAS